MRYDARSKTELEKNLSYTHNFSIYYPCNLKQDTLDFLYYWIKTLAMSTSQGYKDQIKEYKYIAVWKSYATMLFYLIHKIYFNSGKSAFINSKYIHDFWNVRVSFVFESQPQSQNKHLLWWFSTGSIFG